MKKIYKVAITLALDTPEGEKEKTLRVEFPATPENEELIGKLAEKATEDAIEQLFWE